MTIRPIFDSLEFFTKNLHKKSKSDIFEILEFL